MNRLFVITAISLSIFSAQAYAVEQHGTAAGHFAGDIDSKQTGTLKKVGEDTSATGTASRADEAKTDKAIIFQNEGKTNKGSYKGIIIHKNGQNPKTDKAIIFQNEGKDTKKSTGN